MRAKLCVAVAMSSGCSFTAGAMPSGDATTPSDAQRIDVVEIDAPAECAQWKPHHFDPCKIPAPSGGLDLTAGTWQFSTDSGMLASPEGNTTTPPNTVIDQSDVPAYLISVMSLTVEQGATLEVIGGEPLIIASWDTIEVTGTIDVGSSAARPGAGSSPTALCAAIPYSTTAGTTAMLGKDEATTSGGSGGGGGGAFGGNGGSGGAGDQPTTYAGGFGGMHVAAPATVRGGCSGAASGLAGPGDTGNPNALSLGGAGGGAIQLTAKTSIAITGMVLAGGQGGGGSPNGSAAGGGGGGAGGFLGFDAPAISFPNATIAANGGGGGSSNAFAATGVAGQDGQASAIAAMGGGAGSCSEAGMAGGASSNPNGASSANPAESCGGAGGGGAVGFVLTWGPVASGAGTVSPPAMSGP